MCICMSAVRSFGYSFLVFSFSWHGFPSHGQGEKTWIVYIYRGRVCYCAYSLPIEVGAGWLWTPAYFASLFIPACASWAWDLGSCGELAQHVKVLILRDSCYTINSAKQPMHSYYCQNLLQGQSKKSKHSALCWPFFRNNDIKSACMNSCNNICVIGMERGLSRALETPRAELTCGWKMQSCEVARADSVHHISGEPSPGTQAFELRRAYFLAACPSVKTEHSRVRTFPTTLLLTMSSGPA